MGTEGTHNWLLFLSGQYKRCRQKKKTDIKSLILVSYEQFNLLCTLMSYQIQFLKSCLHLKKRVSTGNITKRKKKKKKKKKKIQIPAILMQHQSHQLPLQFSQPELNEMVCNLGLSKNQRYLSLKEQNHKVSYFRNWEQVLWNFLKEEKKFPNCYNILGLLQEFGIPLYNLNDWRLFLDSSKHSHKRILLHNANVDAAVPVTHSVCLQRAWH